MFMSGDYHYKSKWISLVGYVSMCDVHEVIELSGIFDHGSSYIRNVEAFSNIKNGDLVCLTGDQLTDDFMPNYLPLYDNTDIKFIIFSWVRPRSFPLELSLSTQQFAETILSNEHILHIYCIDYDGTKWDDPTLNDKISGVPLGINYHSKLIHWKYWKLGLPEHPSKQEQALNEYMRESFQRHNYKHREIKVYRDDMSNERVLDWRSQSVAHIQKFQQAHKRTADLWLKRDKSFEFRLLRRNIARWNAFYQINGSLVYNEFKRRSTKEMVERRSRYVFILSPFGGGIDCYRTWEALMFGHIVILESSPLDHLYDGLPVVILDDWRHITEKNLTLWYTKYFFNQTARNNLKVQEKLTTKYWIDYMKQLRH